MLIGLSVVQNRDTFSGRVMGLVEPTFTMASSLKRIRLNFEEMDENEESGF